MPPSREPWDAAWCAQERAGWFVHRVRGSDHVMKTLDGRRTSVPVHRNQTLPVGTMEGFIAEAGFTVERLRRC
jgi:predicted RNA binding protein YcfA (HicA-like mRNA interferase family)